VCRSVLACGPPGDSPSCSSVPGDIGNGAVDTVDGAGSVIAVGGSGLVGFSPVGGESIVGTGAVDVGDGAIVVCAVDEGEAVAVVGSAVVGAVVSAVVGAVVVVGRSVIVGVGAVDEEGGAAVAVVVMVGFLVVLDGSVVGVGSLVGGSVVAAVGAGVGSGIVAGGSTVTREASDAEGGPSAVDPQAGFRATARTHTRTSEILSPVMMILTSLGTLLTPTPAPSQRRGSSEPERRLAATLR